MPNHCHIGHLQLASLIVRLLVGCLFVVSAIAKLWGIDSFEVYLYSFAFFPLSISLVAARVVIVAELLLGITFLIGAWQTVTSVVASLLLLVFNVFLCYALIIQRHDSCQCVGQIVSISPTWSLIKNSVLLLFTLFLTRHPHHSIRPRWWIWLPVSVGVTATIFILSVPDCWMFGSSHEAYNATELKQLSEPNQPLHHADIYHGSKVVVFASERCPYCRMALQKLQAIATRHHLDQQQFVVILPQPKQPLPPSTKPQIPMLQGIRYHIPSDTFNHITYGRRPIILLMHDGHTEHSYHYRNIDEKQIAQFLQ
ncbi:MAG: DoxX family protein [Bacteroidales bacterium]|nr:DoxX family protein [Candidatus Colimorpha onthohippi]